jgi:ketosteroid isomerase-like protein
VSAIKRPERTTHPGDPTEATRTVVDAFFRRMAARDPDAIAALFAEQIDWYIPGHEALAPWLGRRRTRQDVADFFRQLNENVEPLRVELRRTLVEGDTAIATGEFASRMRRTSKVVESPFFIEITVRDGQITRYRLLEDSFAVVVALTP